MAYSGVSSPPLDPAGQAGGIDAASARKLIDQVNIGSDIQTAFFDVPKPKEADLEFWRSVSKWLADTGHVLAQVFAPLGPALPFVVWGLVIAAVVLLLSPVVRLFITTRFERLFASDRLKADVPWRPSRAAVTALLEEIDALAAKGEYDEAVHLLLMRSVADINAFRPDLVRLHYSARDICTHPLLPEGARPAFRRIVEWVEKSFFAGVAVGKAGFDACRAAYMDFVAAEGLA